MPTTAVINASASGANVLVAASAVPTGFAVRVLAWQLSLSGAVNAKFQSSGGTDLPGLVYGPLASGAPQSVNSPPLGLDANRGQFQTLKNEGLTLNLSAAVAVGGYVIYEFVSQ
jgi:hypothetical protein